MRWSVVASDLIFFFPGVYAFIRAFYAARETPARTSWALAAALVRPGVLIDHGHSRYNGISLGLVAAAAAAVVSDRDLLGAALFSLALNHKQMSLYYAPAFSRTCSASAFDATHARAGRSRSRDSAPSSSASSRSSGHLSPSPKAPMVSRTPAWGVFSPSCAASRRSSRAYTRITSPTYCATNPIFSMEVPSDARLRQTGAGAHGHRVRALRGAQIAFPSAEGFVWCLANTAWAFFLFSFQAHEKSALLPLLPNTLLSLRAPELVAWLPPIVCFSMWPLLRRDGLAVAYVASVAVFCALVGGGAPGKKADEEKRYAFGRTVDDAPRDDGRDRDCGDCAPRRGDDSTAEGVPAPARSDLLGVVVRGVRGARRRRPTGDSGRRRRSRGGGAREARKRTSSDALR